MAAKMVGKPYRHKTRSDWDSLRIHIMRWSLNVKLAQNFLKFVKLFEETRNKDIVEESKKDKFWGAIRSKDNTEVLIGVNALGRLLMELRQKYKKYNRSDLYKLLYVKSLEIPEFLLYKKPIKTVDKRQDQEYINYYLSKKSSLEQSNLMDEKKHSAQIALPLL